MAEGTLTKKAIAQSLKTICKEKTFDKITVSDLTSNCGINRQTFYYHFQDKYELLSWIYYNDAFLPIMEDLNFGNWDQKLADLFVHMKEEQFFYVNTIKYSDTYFQEYLITLTKQIFIGAIDDLDEEHLLSDEERELFAHFYAYGIYGTVARWVTEGMKTPPRQLANYLKRLAISSERAAFILSANS